MVIKDLMLLYRKLSWSKEDKDTINKLQSKLDEIYMNKARGAYVRSRARWIEEGEKNSAFFCNLEKRRQEHMKSTAL